MKLIDGNSGDFETKSSYSVTISAADDASHSASLTYTINVTDVNEGPTAVALSASAIDENSAGAGGYDGDFQHIYNNLKIFLNNDLATSISHSDYLDSRPPTSYILHELLNPFVLDEIFDFNSSIKC